MSYRPRLKDKYNSEIVKTLTDKFGYKSSMRVPKLTKIVLSQGMGDAVADKKLIDSAAADLSKIAGQKAITTLSKKDISTYQEKIGNIAEVNTIDYFYKNKKNENVEIVVSIELNLNLIIDDILKLDANYIIFETFYVSRFESIKEKLFSKYKIYKINESIIVYKRIN